MDTFLEQTLLEVSKSALQAHTLGLIYAGYGKWANKHGKIVAKTSNNKLIMLMPKKPKPHKLHKKTNIKNIKFGNKLNVKKLSVDYLKLQDIDSTLNSVVKKHKLNSVDKKKLDNEFKKQHLKIMASIATKYKRRFKSSNQLKKFFSTTDEFRTIKEWQWNGFWDSADRKKTTKIINSLAKSTDIKLKINKPIYRGILIKSGDVKKFMKNFKKGKNIQLPPSGFSPKSKISFDFARPNHYTDSTSVLIMLYPKNNKLRGIALSHLGLPVYKSEYEIIRPSNVLNTVIKIEKVHYRGSTGSHRTMYIIHLQETDKQKSKGLMEGINMSQELKKIKMLLIKYMAGSIKDSYNNKTNMSNNQPVKKHEKI